MLVYAILKQLFLQSFFEQSQERTEKLSYESLVWRSMTNEDFEQYGSNVNTLIMRIIGHIMVELMVKSDFDDFSTILLHF